MKRKVININESLCNGCGDCIPNCPEGAIQIVDGKARLISDIFCDGLGACIGYCPLGAIKIEEREAEEYDEVKVMPNIVKAGKNTIIAHLKHLYDHGEMKYLNQAIEYLKNNNLPVPEYNTKPLFSVCPGSNAINIEKNNSADDQTNTENNLNLRSELTQWPIQLQLINPNSQFFDNSDLLITADCVPFTYADFHRRFLKNRKLIILCPKLDKVIESYIEKLSIIFENHSIKSVTIVRMEVPCCGGTNYIVEEALKKSGKNIIVKEYIISLKGDIV